MNLYNLGLNLAKCAFGVNLGKFLSFMMSLGGIKFNLEKLDSIKNMNSLTYHKDVQWLNGCFSAFGRFLSKLGETSLHFFLALRENNFFE